MKIVCPDSLNRLTVKILQEQIRRELHLFAVINPGKYFLKPTVIELSSQHEATFFIGPNHLSNCAMLGDKNDAVLTLTDVDADTANGQDVEHPEAIALSAGVKTRLMR